MKIAIVAFGNIKFSPYIFPYVDVLKKQGAEIELIYPNRMGIKEEFADGILREIKWDNTKNKALNFVSFKSQVSKILKKGKYDFVIVLTTFPAVLLAGVLKSRYRGKYLVDVRDFTHEDSSVYYYFEKKVLKNASLRVISSPGFKNFLPEEDYCICHNVSAEYKSGARHFAKKDSGKIVIGYVGSIAYAANCKKIIDLVKKDDRFCFCFYGNEKGSMPVTSYVKECNCERIKCFGEYSPSQKSEIIEGVDMMFNVYGNGKPLVRYALSNKLYDSMYFKKPLLVSPDTDMQRQGGDFAYAIEPEKVHNLDDLYKWYMNIRSQDYEEYANTYIDNAFETNKEFEKRLIEVLNKQSI